jgi:hypothetical protein
MPLLSTVVTVLRKEREIAAMAVAKLDDAITTLQKLSRNGARPPAGVGGRKARRRMSAAGRRRIAAAQRARWAKVKAKQAKKAA